MTKLLLLIIVAGAIYAGMNWEKVSTQIDSGVTAVEDVKDGLVDMKERAENKLDDTKDKIEELTEKVR